MMYKKIRLTEQEKKLIKNKKKIKYKVPYKIKKNLNKALRR